MRLGILGTGLIGSSIGLRARIDGTHVMGCDANASAIAAALEGGAIDERTAPDDLYERCEYVVIATPLEAACAELRRLRGRALPCAVVMDVASVKRPIAAAAAGMRNFVGSHPLAGSERSGSAAARADLFEGKGWAYLPSGDALLDERAAAFVRSLGAKPIAIDAPAHDAALALTSHLPQLVATVLAGRIRAAGPGAESLCGPAGREVLRLGASSPNLWREIIAANADEIGAAGRALAEALQQLCESLAAGESEMLLEAFGRAAEPPRVDAPNRP